MELTHGEGAEATMDCTGLPEPRVAAVQSAATWGRMCFVGEGGATTLRREPRPDPQAAHPGRLVDVQQRWASGSARASSPTARSRSAGSSPTASASTRPAEAYKLFDTQTTGKGVFTSF